MNLRPRQLAPVGVVLVLTAAGFFATRALGQRDARRDSIHRADIAATQVRDRVDQAATLVDGVRRFLAGNDSSGSAAEQFAAIGANWLGPVGLPAAAWVERVPGDERASYERRAAHGIVAMDASGVLARAGPRDTYLPATLATGSPPMTARGIDLGGIPGIAAAVVRPQTAYRVSATPLVRLPDDTIGLFLVQSAQRLDRGIVEPGYAVLFVPASWLLAGAVATGVTNPRLQLTVDGVSAGDLHGAPTARSTFTAAGHQFEVLVPRLGVHGPAEVLPWLIGAAGLVLAALAGALAVIAARRARAKAEVDRLFTISPDLIVIAGFDGYFKRVNPAFEAELGYTKEEALSRRFTEFVHPDDRQRTEAEGSRLRSGKTTIAFENRYVCKNGSYRWIEWTATPVPEERLIYAVARDVTERRQAEADLHAAKEHSRSLADEQAALRYVATLVAGNVSQTELFAAVAEQIARVCDVGIGFLARFEPDATATIVARHGDGGRMDVGFNWPLDDTTVTGRVFQTGRTARMDDEVATAGAPIVVDGHPWGVAAASTVNPDRLPEGVEQRIANFAELVATAIANAESRAELARLAEEQAALRRVATLVARGTPSQELFTAVVEEVHGLLPVGTIAMGRYDADQMLTTVAIVGEAHEGFPVGTRWPIGGRNISTIVARTRRPARIDSYADAPGALTAAIREERIGAGVGTPIIVEGRLWGVMTASASPQGALPPGIEERLVSFTELVATAIANAESRSELAASRTRIVAASDETRRRIERDLHDGTQQRLVSLSLELRLAETTVPPELEEARTTIGRVAGELNRVIDELREISRGIHPAILSEGGLGPALRTLARRAGIPIEVVVLVDGRLPEPIEVGAYYVVSEALTNAAKHANASNVDVEAVVRDGRLRLSIRDDGVGGADPAGGSGLIGLRDRVEALGGSIEISGPPGRGTHIAVELPLEPAADESKEARPPRVSAPSG